MKYGNKTSERKINWIFEIISLKNKFTYVCSTVPLKLIPARILLLVTVAGITSYRNYSVKQIEQGPSMKWNKTLGIHILECGN